jgi:hypothetical protein
VLFAGHATRRKPLKKEKPAPVKERDRCLKATESLYRGFLGHGAVKVFFVLLNRFLQAV